MIAALLETADDEPVVAEDNTLMDHPEEPLVATDDEFVAPEDDALMAAVDTASVVVVVAIPMISLLQCQYFVVFLYLGTGFDTDHI
jgi:hypothetical protein